MRSMPATLTNSFTVAFIFCSFGGFGSLPLCFSMIRRAAGNTGTVTASLVLCWMKVSSSGHLFPLAFHASATISGKRLMSDMRAPVQHPNKNKSRTACMAVISRP